MIFIKEKIYIKMKALFYIYFSLLVFINAQVNVAGKNETHPHQKQQHQNTFLVKTTLTKEQIESFLKQHQDNPQVEQTQLKVKKEKSKKNHKKETEPEIGVTEIEVPKKEEEPPEQKENSSGSFSIFDYFFGSSDDNESDKNDTEEPPEPDLEKPENETKISENQENGEIPENAETAAENSANEKKENDQVTLLANEGSTKKANIQSGMTISGFFSVILLTIAFGFFLVYATQPKKISNNYSKSLNRIKISF